MAKKKTPRQGPQRPLKSILRQAQKWIEQDQPEEAVELLGRTLKQHPHEVSLHRLLAEAHIQADEPHSALQSYERALDLLPRDGELLRATLTLSAELGLGAHALRAARGLLALQQDDEDVRQAVQALEAQIDEMAQDQGASVEATEEAFYQMEQGQRAVILQQNETAVEASRRALELLPNWLPARIGFALTLPFLGHPAEAIAQSQIILEQDPANAYALANLVRCYAMSGQQEQAGSSWERLRPHLSPLEDIGPAITLAEAAAWMDQDRAVYDLVRPFFPGRLSLENPSPDRLRALDLLASAAANLGLKGEALQAWELLDVTDKNEWYQRCGDALREGRSGPGWMLRYPYFTPAQILPLDVFDQFIDLIEQDEAIGGESDELLSRCGELAGRYPALVQVAEFLLWAERLPEIALPMLECLDTHSAREALYRFATSQAGPDDDRLEALCCLHDMGALSPDESFRFWLAGAWIDTTLDDLEVWDGDENFLEVDEEWDDADLPVPLIRYGQQEAFPEQAIPVEEEWEWAYAPELLTLMEQADQAAYEQNLAEAIRLYRRILDLDPQVKEAYHNLGAVYAMQGNLTEAAQCFRQALDVDPQYVFPLGNLALFALQAGDLAAAKEWLAPLQGRIEFYEDELVLFYYVRARIEAAEGHADEADRLLFRILQIDPEYEPAQSLLLQLSFEALQESVAGLAEHQRESFRRHHQRVRSRITTAHPSLQQTLSALTVDALQGVGENLLPEEKLHALRKADLVERLKQALLDPLNLGRLLTDLQAKPLEALRLVVQAGGAVARADVTRLFGEGNEDEESPYWKYNQPRTPLGILRARGLLAEGVVEGEELVVVPQELREGLRKLLETADG